MILAFVILETTTRPSKLIMNSGIIFGIAMFALARVTLGF